MFLSVKIQEMLGNYHSESMANFFIIHNPSKTREAEWEERNAKSESITFKFMKEAGVNLLPQVQSVLAEIEAMLAQEDKAIADKIQPILKEAERYAVNPTNPLGYNELASILVKLKGYLSVRMVFIPTVFLGYRYTKEDELLANSFKKLIESMDINVVTAKTAKAEDINEKVKRLIGSCDGTIVIFTKDQELKEGGWATSAWLLDEKAFTIGQSKEVVLFFESCIAEKQRKGIQGDLEYIEFNRENLSDAFLDAIPYLKDFRQKILNG